MPTVATINTLVNTQYSRQKQKIFTETGIEPTLYSGDTSSFSEEDQMVLGNFIYTDLLDGEIAINTADNRFWFRSDDEIIELSTGSTGECEPAGSNYEIQFNSGDTFGAYEKFYYNYDDYGLTLGNRTGDTGKYSFVLGGDKVSNEASNDGSFANGQENIASGANSHAEGVGTTASGSATHSEGSFTIASGIYSHAEGYSTQSDGSYSHAEGYETQTIGRYSHSEGYNTIAASYAEHVQGAYNYTGDTADVNNWISTDQLFVIGNGNSSQTNNAFTIYKNGNAILDGSLTATTYYGDGSNLTGVVSSLENLTDVNVSAVTDNQMLLYNSSSSTWENVDYNGIPDEVVDDTLDALKVVEQTPVNTFFTDSELLVSEQDLTTSYADFGSEIDMEGYNKLGLYIDLDVNDSTDIYLKIKGLDEVGGTEYDLYNIDAKKLTEEDGSYYYEIDIDTVPFIQVKAYSSITGSTTGDLTIKFNKRYLKSEENDYLTENITDITNDPTGFYCQSDITNASITASYDNTDRTITLTGDFEAYYKGEIVEELTNGWTSPAHDSGLTQTHFLQFNGEEFEWTTTFDIRQLFIAFVIVQNNEVIFTQREIHGLMPWQSHSNFHYNIGTRREIGGDLSNYTLNSTSDRRPSTSECQIYDEDFRSILNEHLSAETYTIINLESGGTYLNFITGQTDIVLLSGDQPYWNEFDGSTWNQTLVNNNDYMAMYQIAVPTTSDDFSKKYRYLWSQGQVSGSLSEVKAETPSSLNNSVISNLAPEYVFINKVIIQYTASNWKIVQVDSITGNRSNQIIVGGGYLSSVATDSTLDGDGTPSNPLSIATEAGVFAYLSGSSTTTISTGDTFQYIEGTFDNPVIESFSTITSSYNSGPAIQCNNTITSYYEIDWHATIKGDSNGITTKIGIGINGNQPDMSSIMSSYLKTANEIQNISGTVVVSLSEDDEVQLMITGDDTSDQLTVDYFTTTIRPFL